jgi:hypothetical protein
LQIAHKHTPLSFHCEGKVGKAQECWDGRVTSFTNYGSHCEFHIESRSAFSVIVGTCSGGNFISIPAFNVGSSLVTYDNYLWNHERLSKLFNKVDAATVAEALRTLKQHNYFD